jgi:hypothetical protein
MPHPDQSVKMPKNIMRFINKMLYLLYLCR